MDNNVLINAIDIHKTYAQGSSGLDILKGINLKVFEGEALAILGASGAGKSTLLHILGTLDKPNSGELYFRGRNLLQMSDEELATFRNREMGFVFQFHHLISELNALENVTLPARIAGEPGQFAKEKAETLLEMLGLRERLKHFPNQLSGGELQRVAIARSLICRPRVLLADEPTGNLDSYNSGLIQDLFFKLKENLKLTLIVVTHDLQFAQKFAKRLRMRDGQWAQF